jgi:hypothetical protein
MVPRCDKRESSAVQTSNKAWAGYYLLPETWPMTLHKAAQGTMNSILKQAQLKEY